MPSVTPSVCRRSLSASFVVVVLRWTMSKTDVVVDIDDIASISCGYRHLVYAYMFYVFFSISQYYILVNTHQNVVSRFDIETMLSLLVAYIPSYPVDIIVKLSWNYRYRQLSYMFKALSISMISSGNCRGTVDINNCLVCSQPLSVLYGPNPCWYRWYRRETVVELSILTNCFVWFYLSNSPSILTTVLYCPNPCWYRWYQREIVVELSISTDLFLIFYCVCLIFL